MKFRLIVGILIFLCGCVAPIRTLKPNVTYLLKDGHKVTVYRTHNESIYVIDDSKTIIEKE